MPQLSSLGGSNLTLVKKNPKDSLIFRVTEPYTNANIRVGTSVDISDSYMIVSGNGAANSSSPKGHAYIYNLANGALIAHANNDVINDQGYGTSVSVARIKGPYYGKIYCAIGAPTKSTAYGNTGRVFIYNAPDGAYVKEFNCNSHVTNTAARDSRFGHSVSINGDYVYIGAPNHAVTNNSITYANNGTVQVAALISTGCDIINSPVYQDNLFWGYSVALSIPRSGGTTGLGAPNTAAAGVLVVGAPGYNSNTGMVLISGTSSAGGGASSVSYDYMNNIIYGVNAGDEFGSTVAACNNYIAVAARGANSGAGRVYIFHAANNTLAADISMNDINTAYGYSTSAGDSISSISINDDSIAIGVAGEDSSANTNTGVVYLFDFVSSITPVGASWTAVSAGQAGGAHTVALTSNNLLFTWGYNKKGQIGNGFTTNRSTPVQINSQGLFSWTAISTGHLFTAAIRSDGGLFTWGYNNYGQLGDGTTVNKSKPAQIGSSSWTAVSTGLGFTVAIRSDNKLFSWGRGNYGRLGDGTTVSKSSPVQIGSSNWVAVSAGRIHAAAIRSGDRRLFTWGYGGSGRLGYNFTTSVSAPVQIGTSSWTAVSAGLAHTHAITLNGYLWAWGLNNKGQIGNGTTIDRSSPVLVNASSWTKISAGYRHTAAIKTDGTLWAWGDNSTGQLGVDTTTLYSWTAISTGQFHSAAIRSDGRLFTWGLGQNGQLGDGTTVAKSSPVQVGTSSWIAVSAGGAHTAAIRSDNKLFTWGAGAYGRLGDGTATRSSPVQIGSSNWTSVSAGSTHTAAIRSGGSLFTWGYGGKGALGQNDLTTLSSPVQVGGVGGSNWTSVSAGANHTVAIRSGGSLFTWGSGAFGVLGDGTTITKSSPVQIGSSSWTVVAAGVIHTAAITSDGSLFTWGYGTQGALGQNDLTTLSSPAQVGGVWTSVSAGANHTVAIRSGGSLWAWGRNNNGQLGDGTTVNKSSPVQIGSSSWTAVSAGGGAAHTAAIRSGGSLFTWGWGAFGQLGDGTTVSKSSPVFIAAPAIEELWQARQVGTSSWTAVSAGYNHTAAIRSDGNLFTWGGGLYGRLGDSTTINKSSPVAVSSVNVKSLFSITSGSTKLKAYKSFSTDTGNFGYSTALSGSKLAIGAPNINFNSLANSGTVSVYNTKYPYLNTTIIPTFVKTDPNSFSTGTGDVFGNTVYCSKDSDYVAILAAGEDDVYTADGVVYVYGASNGTLMNTLTIPTPNIANGSWSTISTSMSGTKVILSTYSDANTNVIITDITGATSNVYIQQPVENNTYFGNSVDISGNNVVVGAPFKNGANTDCGAAYIYASNGQLQYTLTPPNPATSGNYGNVVCISNTYTLVAQPNGNYTNSGGSTVKGRVYVYYTVSGSLVYTLENPGKDPTTSVDNFGHRIAIYKDIGIISSPGESFVGGGPSNYGWVHIYDLSTGTLLSSIQNPSFEWLVGYDDYFGQSVAVYDDILVVGAPYEDFTQDNSGVIYVFDISTPTVPRLLETINAYDSELQLNGLYGTSVSINSNTIVVGNPFIDNAVGDNAGTAFFYSYSKSKY